MPISGKSVSRVCNMEEWKERACAKINLSIDVLGLRPDGYHEVEMVMQSVDLCDELALSRRDDGALHLDCDPPVTGDAEDNLVVRAARLLQTRYDVPWGATLTLRKNIPVQAGLGGGSSDAAATLRGLNRLWELGLSLTQLEELGAELGSDVPYCVQGGTAFAYGRGEKLRSLPSFGTWNLLLIKPSFGLSTPEVYSEFDKREHTCKYASRAIARSLTQDGGDITFSSLPDLLHNDLQTVSSTLRPEVGQLLLDLRNRGAVALMSGSGPTVLGFFAREEDRAKACEEFLAAGYQCHMVRTIA